MHASNAASSSRSAITGATPDINDNARTTKRVEINEQEEDFNNLPIASGPQGTSSVTLLQAHPNQVRCGPSQHPRETGSPKGHPAIKQTSLVTKLKSWIAAIFLCRCSTEMEDHAVAETCTPPRLSIDSRTRGRTSEGSNGSENSSPATAVVEPCVNGRRSGEGRGHAASQTSCRDLRRP